MHIFNFIYDSFSSLFAGEAIRPTIPQEVKISPPIERQTSPSNLELSPNDPLNRPFKAWESFPHELIQVIFYHLSQNDRIIARGISKSWLNAMSIPCKFLPEIIDIRTVPELNGIEKECPSDVACKVYRNFRAVVNVVGGWEKYRNLPEIVLGSRSCEELKSSDLPAPLVRIKRDPKKAGVAFRHINTYCKDIEVGILIQKEPCSDGWYITFGPGFPSIQMNRQLGRYNLDPEDEEGMTDKIKTPMQVLKNLFSRPAHNDITSVTSDDQLDLTEIQIKLENRFWKYKIMLVDIKKQ